ncbi:MAG: PDZ domain-containing protein, partial [Clostridia bacterium]|nr:PDZ domain-containing protein [Clostridia bacterium]
MVFVTGIIPHSPAEKAGIRSGDAILSVNGNEINDVLDYQFYT